MNDFMTIARSYVRVPHAFWIDDNHGSVAALVEAPCLVDPNTLFQPQFGNLVAKLLQHIL